MTSLRRFRAAAVVNLLTGCAVICLSCLGANAQDEDYRLPGPIPAPIRFVPADQQSRLSAETDLKKRLRLTLDLVEARLTKAEALTTQQDFTAAALELGNYQGLIHESIAYFQAQPNNGKVRDVFKNLEMALRTNCARLEGIRRNTPMGYSNDVKDVIRFTEDSRDVSLSCFFGETVLRSPNTAPTPAKPSDSAAPKNP